MECVVKWAGGDSMTFLAETALATWSGWMAPRGRRPQPAPRPMELMLAGAGGCTAFDVVLILKRSRQDVVDCAVSLKADRAETDPKVFSASPSTTP